MARMVRTVAGGKSVLAKKGPSVVVRGSELYLAVQRDCKITYNLGQQSETTTDAPSKS
jgi:hypothetical protein